MRDIVRQVALAAATSGVAAVLLFCIFFVLKLIMDAGLEVVLPVVVVAGLLLAYALRWQEASR